MQKLFTAFYIFVLSSSTAVIFLLGAFVAPSIFHTEKLHGVALLSHYDAGLLMSEIFVKSNYILLITLVTILFYDGARILKRRSDALSAVLAVLSSIGLGLHLFFFTPKILEYQAAGEGATKLETFAAIHHMSELDFKFMLACIITLCFARLSTSLKDNCCEDNKAAK